MTEGKGISERYAAAWAMCRNPPLDSENPHFRNRFASLAATLGAVRDACVPNGLAYLQVVRSDGQTVLETSVTDGSETLQLSTVPLAFDENPQVFGKNLTYCKRQAAQCDWGIVGEEDDDGNAAADYANGKSGVDKGLIRKIDACVAKIRGMGGDPSALVSGYRHYTGDPAEAEGLYAELVKMGKQMKATEVSRTVATAIPGSVTEEVEER